jgi:2-keto-4-pentenoate hydratase/2-oxohepta-3-ene-1,7-dioic acid hydratase in catechol pathway
MKLFRFGEFENEKPGVITAAGKKLDVSSYINDYDEAFFKTDGLTRVSQWLSINQDTCPEVNEGVRIGACIARPSKIICIGLNYAKHAQETNAPIPAEPILFFKSTTALCGPNDNIVIPKNSTKTDWEVELAIVIGKKATYVDEQNAMDYVAGYALHNDYSEREFQLERGGQWVKGKSCDTFAPLGPFLATKEEVANANSLRLWLNLNGEKVQDSNTDDMIFKIPFLISYVSQFMTLLPGDVISTGTPFGVGLGFKPPRYLKPNDIIELGIEGLGTQRQQAVAYQQ